MAHLFCVFIFGPMLVHDYKLKKKNAVLLIWNRQHIILVIWKVWSHPCNKLRSTLWNIFVLLNINLNILCVNNVQLEWQLVTFMKSAIKRCYSTLLMMWKGSKMWITLKGHPSQYVEDSGGSASLLLFAGWEPLLVCVVTICKSNLAHFQNFMGKCNQNLFLSAIHFVTAVKIFFHFLHLWF